MPLPSGANERERDPHGPLHPLVSRIGAAPHPGSTFRVPPARSETHLFGTDDLREVKDTYLGQSNVNTARSLQQASPLAENTSATSLVTRSSIISCMKLEIYNDNWYNSLRETINIRRDGYMTYDEALELYLERYTNYSDWSDAPLQPSYRSSSRNEKDNGWIMRNINGYLAFVSDRGYVLTFMGGS